MLSSAIRSGAAQASMVLLFSLAGCASAGAHGAVAPQGEGKLITAAMIDHSGADNAWEVLRRTGTHLSLRENANGEPTKMTYRGHHSVLLSSTPLLVVDGSRMVEFTYLRSVPASMIQSIRLLNGTSGTKLYGTGAGNGVVVVTTASAPRH